MSEHEENETMKKLDEVNDTMQTLGKYFPDIMKSFLTYFQGVDKPGTIDTKTKKLISLAISINEKCSWCVAYYVNKAIEAGATKEEILETSMVAMKMGGGPSLMHIRWVLDALGELGKL
ncbi:MAG: carboxymuconolactone decarboxylase family protein [Candidatus Lokiarchaeota archaeon]|nr:carboxymuconolactone decarboxylase family protein [Candidatus Lokiarchaeota archaeon]